MDFITKHKSIIEIIFGKLDLSISDFSLTVLLVPLLFFSFSLILISKKSYYPGMMQNFAEFAYESLYDFFYSYLGEDGKQYINFLFCLAIFIFLLNIFSLVPGIFPTTSQVGVTFTLSLMVFFLMIAIGFYEHGLGFYKLFIPEGLPTVLKPLLFILELFSFFIRPISLAARLTINMFAGHIMLHILASFASGFFITSIVLVALTVITLFKIGVSLLQAYIFCLLSALYISQIVHGH